MSVAAVNTALGLLSLIAIATTLAAAVMVLSRQKVGAEVAWGAIAAAFAITAVATAGSLYYSLSAGYPPCDLCWYQRIAIYPQTVILGVALLRNDMKVAFTAIPLATAGVALSAWHVALERMPALSGPCDPSNPCAIRWVETFGFLTIPTMALITGLSTIALTGLAARYQQDTEER